MKIPEEDGKVIPLNALGQMPSGPGLLAPSPEPIPTEPGMEPGPEPIEEEERKSTALSRQLAPVITQAADRVEGLVKKLKTPYFTGMVHGIVIILTMRYLNRKDD